MMSILGGLLHSFWNAFANTTGHTHIGACLSDVAQSCISVPCRPVSSASVQNRGTYSLLGRELKYPCLQM